ncbi:MAG: hypothetical protein EWM72_02935 [Nitrospira sp.]|nr:MAG: hypothetical protein EWM72_02935 [Nitrospira sp.]
MDRCEAVGRQHPTHQRCNHRPEPRFIEFWLDVHRCHLEQFISTVTQLLHSPLVHVLESQRVRIKDEYAVYGRIERLQSLALRPLHPLALGDIANRGDGEQALLGRQGAQAHFHIDFAAVFSPSEQLTTDSHRPDLRVVNVSCLVMPMGIPQPSRQQHLDGLIQQFLTRISEQLFRLVVHDHDPASTIDNDHGVGRSVQQAPEFLFHQCVFQEFCFDAEVRGLHASR